MSSGGKRENAGRPKKDRTCKQITITLTPSQYDLLKNNADYNNLSISKLVVNEMIIPYTTDKGDTNEKDD